MVNGVFNLGFQLGYVHGDQKIKKVGYNQGGILGSYWYSTWDMIGDSYLGSIWSTLRTTPSLHFSLWPLPLSAAPCPGRCGSAVHGGGSPGCRVGGGGGLLLLLCLLLDYYLSSHSSGASIRGTNCEVSGNQLLHHSQ